MRFRPDPQPEPDLMSAVDDLETIRATVIGTRKALIDGGFTEEAAEGMAALLWAAMFGGGQ